MPKCTCDAMADGATCPACALGETDTDDITDQAITVRLVRDGDEGLEEVDGPGYEPVVCDAWRSGDDLLVENATDIEFPEATGPWGRVDGIQLDSDSLDHFVALDHSLRVGSHLDAETVTIVAGDLSFPILVFDDATVEDIYRGGER